ncbi:MAG: V4R domain-containing protein [Candidatus Heimdallarchaeaceae archaeon]
MNLKKLYLREPVFFDIFDPDIPLKLFLSSIEYENSLLESYPDETIKLVRSLYKQYTGDVGAKILTAIGHFFGYRLNEKANKDKIVTTIDDLLKLLNEISVAEFNKGNSEIVLEISPVCRGFTSEDPMCHFFTGFIKVVLNNPLLTITETKCRAKGDKYCTFEITQQD